mmetsp:Transcript_13563/g.34813  ORF Transcript_13563/g.34813 Transcript_13563/m.34813 type:complete len:153 (-) Transcript_13563:610-1068(-)
MADWDGDGESCGDRETDKKFHAAREKYKIKKREVRKARDSLRHRQEETEQQALVTTEEHARILRGLRERLGESTEALERQRKRQREVELEFGTLRGRITHSAKEQCEWEAEHKLSEQEAIEEVMLELVALRQKNPAAAAAFASVRGDKLLME